MARRRSLHSKHSSNHPEELISRDLRSLLLAATGLDVAEEGMLNDQLRALSIGSDFQEEKKSIPSQSARQESLSRKNKNVVAGKKGGRKKTSSRKTETSLTFSHVPLQNWQAVFEQRKACFPRSIAHFASCLDDVSIESLMLYSDGWLTGNLVQADGCRYTIYVSLNAQPEKIAGCNCYDSDGAAPCVHSYRFIGELLKQVARKKSPVAKLLGGSEVAVGSPDWQVFEYSDAEEIRRKLIALPQPDAIRDEDHSTLEPLEDVEAERLCWDIVIDDTVQVYVRAQKLKKRGSGWLKGKRVSLEEARRRQHLATSRDQEVINLFELDNGYYHPKWIVDPLVALAKLEGADNVLLCGSPAQVVPLDMTLVVQETSDGVSFVPIQLEGKADCDILRCGASGFVAVIHNEGKIYYSSHDTARATLLNEVLRFQDCPVELKPELVEKLKSYRNIISLKLPVDEGGEIVPVPFSPVVILRSRTDGALDYGLRTRLPDGKLLTPGQGVLVFHKTDAANGGCPVQWQRDVNLELQQARRLLGEFSLPDQFNGTIRDFEIAIGLIDQLQSLEPGTLEVLWDKETAAPIKVLGSISSKNVQVGLKAKRDWFQVSGACQFSEQSVDLNAILACMSDTDATAGGYVKVGEQGWAKISEELRSQLLALKEATSQDRNTLKLDATSAPAIRQLMAGHIEVDADKKWSACLSRLEKSEKLEPKLPKGLKATLRDYQVDGYKWLRRLAEWGVGGVLADDMGLGKTLQTLAVLLDRKKNGPALVIAPTSVAFNWKREAEKFAPQLNVHSYRETDRSEFLRSVGANDLVVCSYGLALRDAQQLGAVDWSTLVLDEAQAVKNSRSKTAAAIASIPADWRLALTGTPVENHLGELWSLFHVISPGVFGGWESFKRRYATPIEKQSDEQRRLALRNRLRPFILRRTKTEVLTDLPPRSESNVYIELSAAERAAYEAVRRSAIGEIDEIANLPKIQDQRFRLLALLTRLRQLSCSPKLVHDNWTERSSKLQTLLQTVKELQQEGHRVLVFSQFVKHLNLIREMFADEAVTFEYLDGSTPAAERQDRVDRFQSGQATAFLISLKAGGTGLNLTAADYVIHMDPWWNPAVEDQATDRAHRIGQDKPVMVYRMISEGTIEEEILRLHESKRDLVAGILEGAQASAKMSTDELIRLVRGQEG